MPADRLRFSDLRRTSTFRLTLRLSLAFAIGMIALLGLIYAMTVRELTARNDLILREQVAHLLGVPQTQLLAQIALKVQSNQAGLDYVALLSPLGEQLSGNIRVQKQLLRHRPFEIERSADHGPLRLISVQTSDGETIIIGRDISQIRDLQHRLLEIVIATGLAMMISVALAAIALSVRPLRRVRDFQAASREIASGRLDIRMPVSGRHDELDQFAIMVNVMVEDVARVMAQVKGITDAVAHDLRTPLTRLRGHLHRAQLLPDNTPSFANLAEKAVADLDQVLDRFAALLRISEIEASARRSGFATIDLVDLLQNVFELYEPLAEERGVALVVHSCSPSSIEADDKLLFEAVSNLVDNAIKFARGSASIAITRLSGIVQIDIADDGPGIAVEERDAVLQRFHRGAHAAGLPGSGLGLSVVAAIVHLHGFALSFEDGSPGLIARITIPV
jgi:signal transduction histidine kinase